LLSPVSIHHQDHVSGSTSGSTSVSSVSSSGSADDQSQLVASRFAFSPLLVSVHLLVWIQNLLINQSLRLFAALIVGFVVITQ
jgi:hypothetical protein